MSLDEISRKLHEFSARKKMIKDFKSNIREDNLSNVSDVSMGYALSIINGKKYLSSISNIRFGNRDQKYNVKFK